MLTFNIKDAERLDAAVQTTHKTPLPSGPARVSELPAAVLSMCSDSPERVVATKRLSLIESTSADLIHLIIS